MNALLLIIIKQKKLNYQHLCYGVQRKAYFNSLKIIILKKLLIILVKIMKIKKEQEFIYV